MRWKPGQEDWQMTYSVATPESACASGDWDIDGYKQSPVQNEKQWNEKDSFKRQDY